MNAVLKMFSTRQSQDYSNPHTKPAPRVLPMARLTRMIYT